MGTKQELITNLEGAIALGKTNLAAGGVDTTNIHSVYGVVKAIPDIEGAGPATLVSIDVTTYPTKKEYTYGSTLDTTGMVITAYYSDGTTADVTSSCTVDVTTITGNKICPVTVTYQNKTTVFNVTVLETIRAAIRVKTLPTKTVYNIGESLDTSGLEVEAVYFTGDTISSIGPESLSYLTIGTLDSSSPGLKTISVSFGTGDQQRTTSFNVFVEGKSGLDWVDDKIILDNNTITDLEVNNIASMNYIKINDDDTLIRPEGDYTYSFGYKGAGYNSPYLNVLPFWASISYQEKTDSFDNVYHMVTDAGLEQGPAQSTIFAYIVHTDGTVINSKLLSKGTWIRYPGTAYFPITILRTTKEEALQKISIDPVTTYIPENYVEITEVNPDPTKFPTAIVQIFKGYRISDKFLPLGCTYYKENNNIYSTTKQFKYYYDAKTKSFINNFSSSEGYDGGVYNDFQIFSVSQDGAIRPSGTIVSGGITYYKTLVFEKKGTYIFKSDPTNITNIVEIGYGGKDIVLSGNADMREAMINNTSIPVLSYNYNGVPAATLSLQDSTFLKTSKKSDSVLFEYFGDQIIVNIKGPDFSINNIDPNSLLKNSQIGSFSYYYTCGQAPNPNTKIFALINDFYLNDGTFVRNPGLYTSLDSLQINCENADYTNIYQADGIDDWSASDKTPIIYASDGTPFYKISDSSIPYHDLSTTDWTCTVDGITETSKITYGSNVSHSLMKLSSATSTNMEDILYINVDSSNLDFPVNITIGNETLTLYSRGTYTPHKEHLTVKPVTT